MVLNLHNIEKSYGITEVLKGFSLTLNEGERVGLIGPNGSGKTTVFKIIDGIEPYSSGMMTIGKGLIVGYLSQMPDFDPEFTLYQELKTVFSTLLELREKLGLLEKEISLEGEKSRGSKGSAELESLMKEYSNLQHSFEALGGYTYESKIRQVAMGMGFTLEELSKKTGVLSGGEKTRLGLVKLLLSEPDILLLDEPTNHLDLSSIQWLESYLGDYRGAVLIISHDRYFLNKVVTRIVELKDGRDEIYYGNYSYYLKEREKRYEQLLHAYQNQQKKIKKMEETIKRLYDWGRQGDNEKFFRRARSMEKALARIERLDRPTIGGDKMKLKLDVSKRSGREVLQVKDVEKSFSGGNILKGLDLDIYWSEKCAIIGKNGTGKTTLLKMVLEELSPDRGKIKVGANVKIGYYSQQFEGFNFDDDLVTALRRETPMNEGEARNALAAFLFTENEVFKQVGDLSGGEKSRLRLLQLTNGDYNFLIMDEPTNHLDLPSREVLEEVLQNYPGTVLVVSHDRYFLNKFIEYTYELKDGKLTRYYGNYDYYLQKKAELELLEKQQDGKMDEIEIGDNEYYKRKKAKKEQRMREKQLENLEEKIMKLEERKKELEEEMASPDNLEDFNRLSSLNEEYQQINEDLNHLYEKWEDYV